MADGEINDSDNNSQLLSQKRSMKMASTTDALNS
jgi:hypothetical protein